jgi:hypothetical protein
MLDMESATTPEMERESERNDNDGNDNDGNDGTGTGSDAGNSREYAADPFAGIGTGTDDGIGNDQTGAGSRGKSSGNERIAPASFQIGKRDASTGGSGSGTGTGSDSDSRTGTGRGTGGRKRRQKSAAQAIPRQVDANDLDSDADDVPGTTKELIGDGIEFTYWALSNFLGDHWLLDSEEVKVLASRVNILIQRTGKRRSKKLLKTIDKVLPGISLTFAACMVTIPRVQQTLANRKQKPAHAQHPTSPSQQPSGSGPETGTRFAADSDATTERNTSRSYYGNLSTLKAVPATRTDFEEFFPTGTDGD